MNLVSKLAFVSIAVAYVKPTKPNKNQAVVMELNETFPNSKTEETDVTDEEICDIESVYAAYLE